MYQLYDKHCLLQHQLRERLASWKWQPLVGDVVARFTDPRHTDVLRLYTAYVNDFPEVLKTFHKLCRTSQPFTKFIKVGGGDLSWLLVLSVTLSCSPLLSATCFVLFCSRELALFSSFLEVEQWTVCRLVR